MILSGLKLCFLPKNSQVRRFKESAARAAGAEVYSEVKPDITHVLVERQGPREAVPAKFKVLYSDWVADSIEAGKLLPESQFTVNVEQEHLAPPLPSQTRQLLRTTEIAIEKSPKRARILHASAPPAEQEQKEKDQMNNSKSRPNVNQLLVNVLSETAALLEVEADEFRAASYWDAAEALSRIDTVVTSGAHARQLTNKVGASAATVIDSCLQRRLPDSVRAKMRLKTEILSSFQVLFGIGRERAKQLYNLGCRSVEDIRAHTKSESVLASIDHYEDMIERISRTEVEQHFELIQQALAKISTSAFACCLGSFRREKQSCGDIDILILEPRADHKRATKLLSLVVEEIRRTNQAAFTFNSGEMFWMGASVLPGLSRWRRLDLFSCPWSERGAKQLHCTGSGRFNRSLRLQAKHMGMHLSDRGLYADQQGKVLLESESEHKIFTLLQINYLEPSQRSPVNISPIRQ